MVLGSKGILHSNWVCEDTSLNAWNMSPSNSKNLKLYGNFPTFLRIHLCWIFQLTKCLILEVLTRGWWKNYSALISKCLIKGNIFSKLFFVYMLSRETWKENKKKTHVEHLKSTIFHVQLWTWKRGQLCQEAISYITPKKIQFQHQFSNWWVQPIWKILVKLDHFPR